MRFGLQVSSLKKYMQTEADVASSMAKIAEMGYTDLQLQWIGEDVPYEFIAEQLKKYNFRCWGTQDYYDVVCARMDKELYAGKLYGSEYICVSGIPERYCSFDGVNVMSHELNGLAARLAASGYKLAFHPRAQEYVKYGDMVATEQLLDAVPTMQFNLDAWHTEVTGIDTAALLKKYAGRTDIVHFKNSVEKKRGTQLCPLGEGAIDYKPVMKACAENGVKIIMAEQESWTRDAFDCMADNLAYLKKTAAELGIPEE